VADWAWADINNEISVTAGTLSATAGSKLQWFGTVRGRVGFIWDRLLVYGTGGYAYGNVDNIPTSIALLTVSEKTTVHTIKAGLNVKLWPGVMR
jgi:outer membrane immunogenic protein